MNARVNRIGFIVVGLLFCAMTMQTHAATITVTNTNDGAPSSLRQALTDAHDGDRIGFSAALNGQTITLTSAELVIDKDITTNGPGPDLLAVSRSSNTPFRIFHVMPGHIVTIQGLMLTGGGDAGNPGGGILNDHGRLTVRNCAVESNGSGNAGGGIFNDGSNGSATLTIINSAVSYNGSPAGGGIGNNGDEGSATLTIVNRAVNYNVATGGSPPADFGVAGGIASSSGIVTITNSTISGNSASNEVAAC